MPRRHRATRRSAPSHRRFARGQPQGRRRSGRRDRPRHARRLDLRPRPNRIERNRIGFTFRPAGDVLMTSSLSIDPIPIPPPAPAARTIELSVDGKTVRVPEGATVLDACRSAGVETPTLCYLQSLTPVNACRVCVVELEGSRTLVPSCARKAEDAMAVKTDTERVRHSRKMVLEFL